MKYIIFAFLLIIPIFCKAQTDTPELVTDRPDQTESSSLVPVKSLQIETGFIMENDVIDYSRQNSVTYNTTLLRYGLLKNFELRLGLDYLKNKEEIKNLDSLNISSGLSPLYTGFKIKVTDENGWIPEIALLGGLALPFTAQKELKPSYPAINMRFAFAHTLSNKFSLGYNIGAEWDGESAIPGYFYSISLGAGLTSKLGMFIESYGLIHEKSDAEHLIDAGFTLLLLTNLQLDISGGLGINDKPIDNFISIGMSFRLPE